MSVQRNLETHPETIPTVRRLMLSNPSYHMGVQDVPDTLYGIDLPNNLFGDLLHLGDNTIDYATGGTNSGNDTSGDSGGDASGDSGSDPMNNPDTGGDSSGNQPDPTTPGFSLASFTDFKTPYPYIAIAGVMILLSVLYRRHSKSKR